MRLENISFTDRQKLGLDILSYDLIQHCDQIQDRIILAVGYVKDLMLDTGSRHRQDVGGHNVVDIRKIPGLFSRAEDGRLFVMQNSKGPVLNYNQQGVFLKSKSTVTSRQHVSVSGTFFQECSPPTYIRLQLMS